MEYVWLGGVAEQSDFDSFIKKGNNQTAANVMQLNYIEGIEANINEGVFIISSHFQPSFPRYKDIVNHRRVWKRKERENVDIFFLNIPLIKHIIKMINIRREIKRIYKKNSEKEITFFIYSLTTPLSMSVPYIKKKFKRAKICYIVPDLPQYMDFGKQSLIKKVLKNIDWRLIRKSIKEVDLFVLFAEEMKKYLEINNKNKYITIEGMINNKKNIEHSDVVEKKNCIMYAGSMNKEYGVLNLVYAFMEMEDKDLELWLYGTGNAVNEIIELSKQDSRIKYKGLVKHSEVLIAEQKAKLLVNPRPTGDEYTKYSFPSKILEYMMSETPLLMTKLYGIPKEYFEYSYTIENNSVEEIYKGLTEFLKISEQERREKGKEAKKFVLREKNNVKQMKKILDKICEEKDEI